MPPGAAAAIKRAFEGGRFPRGSAIIIGVLNRKWGARGDPGEQSDVRRRCVALEGKNVLQKGERSSLVQRAAAGWEEIGRSWEFTLGASKAYQNSETIQQSSVCLSSNQPVLFVQANKAVGVVNLAPPVGVVYLASPVGVVNLAPPVSVVGLAPPVGVMDLASPVGVMDLASPVGVVNLAQPVGVVDLVEFATTENREKSWTSERNAPSRAQRTSRGPDLRADQGLCVMFREPLSQCDTRAVEMSPLSRLRARRCSLPCFTQQLLPQLLFAEAQVPGLHSEAQSSRSGFVSTACFPAWEGTQQTMPVHRDKH